MIIFKEISRIENTIFLVRYFILNIYKISNKSESSIDYKTKKDKILTGDTTKAKTSGAQLTSGPFLFIDFPAGMFIGDRRNPRERYDGYFSDR